jgi:hypothetical protein
MSVTGQDKGVMLQLLLSSSDISNYKAIVFIDDGEKNVENVAKAFQHTGLEVIALRYTQHDKSAEDLPKDRARMDKAKKDYDAVQSVMRETFGRLCSSQ